MKLRKVLSVAAASAIAASALSVGASAKVLSGDVGTVDGNGQFVYDLIAEEVEWWNAKGVFIVLETEEPVEDAFGGCVMMNGTACGWLQDMSKYEFGVNTDEKVLTGIPDDSGKMYLLAFDLDEGVYGAEDDETDDYYAQIVLQQWWGDADIKVSYIQVTDQSATETVEAVKALMAQLGGGVVEDTPTTQPDDKPVAGDVDAATAGGSKDSPDTGVADVAVIAGLGIVAAGAVLVSKKRK